MKKYYFLLLIVLFQMNGFANPNVTPENPTLSKTVDCATLQLTSPAGTTNQTVCLYTPITNITYTFGNGATSAAVSVLPSGVTATISGNVVTITGTPSAPGIYSYIVTTVGGECATSLGGTILVNPNTSLLLASAGFTANQTVCVNEPINNIVYVVGNGGTGATVTGLPAGIVGSFTGGVMTISGAPTVTGVFNYTVTVTGGCLPMATLAGTITVVSGSSLTLTTPAATTNQIVCDGSPILPINYSAVGATGVSVAGLPPGITGNFAAGVFTISGTPTVGGVFNYTVSTSGGCSAVDLGGTITSLPQTPLSIACTPASDSVTFTWNAASVATGYALSYATPGGDVVNVNLGLQYTYTVANLLPQQTVTFTVSPIGNNTCAVPSTATCTTSTLANWQFEESAFNVYPNPVKDLLYIDAASVVKSVTIFNMLGQKILERPVNESKTTIDCSGFQKGIYIMQLTADGKTKTLRIIKG